jgi:hypothetical protein
MREADRTAAPGALSDKVSAYMLLDAGRYDDGLGLG